MRVCLFVSLVAVLVFPAPAGAATAEIDLAKLRPGLLVEVPAPHDQPFLLKISNRLPAEKYRVEIEGSPSLEISPKTDGSSGIVRLTCKNLKASPSAGVGGEKFKDELEVGAAVAEILAVAENCGSREEVEQAVRGFTGWTSTASLPSIKIGEERKVRIVRTTDNQTWEARLSTCHPEKQLSAYLQAHYPFAEDLRVLALDHKRRTWSSYRWRSRTLEPPLPGEFDLPFTNKPLLGLTRDEELAVFLVNTNPLLYSVSPKDSTEEDIEEVAELKQLTALIGTFASEGLAIQGIEDLAARTAAGQDALAEATPQALTQNFTVWAQPVARMNQAVGAPFDNRSIRRIFQETSRNPLEDVLEPVRLTSEALKARVSAISPTLESVSQAAGELEKTVQLVDAKSASLVHHLQMIEHDNPSAKLLTGDSGPQALPDQVQTGFEALEAARGGLVQRPAPCVGGLESLRDLLTLKLEPLPSDEHLPQQRDILARFSEVAGKLGRGQGLEECSDLQSPAVQVALWLARPGNGPKVGGPSSGEESLFKSLRELTAAYLRLAAMRDAMLKKAGEVLPKRAEVGKAAAAFQSVFNRQQLTLLPRDPSGRPEALAVCSLRRGVIEVPRVLGNDIDVEFTKVRKESFKVAAEPRYKDSVLLDHPQEAEAEYHIKPFGSSAWGWDVNVGLTHAEITEEEFSAVGPENGKVIQGTSENTRSGELALFGSYLRRFREGERLPIGAGGQLGVGLNDDHLALFVGPAFRFGRYVNLGLGWSWQEVKDLAGGQEEGMPVLNSEAIKTRDTFEDGFYLSLTINIGGLPFFSGGQEGQSEGAQEGESQAGQGTGQAAQ